MKKILIAMVCLLLIGCNQVKTRGLNMEINLESKNMKVWRCFSNNQDIIKITEENYIEDKNNELNGKYQFRFVGVKQGRTSITCNCLIEEQIVNTGLYYVEIDNNQVIKYLNKTGDIEIVDPVFK